MSIAPFVFDGKHVRIVMRDGVPWFNGKDVCDILEIANSRVACGRLDVDERDSVSSTDAVDRGRKMIHVNESGLYSLVMLSRKPTAKAFKKWVTGEVLPSIRKHGAYIGDPVLAAIQSDPAKLRALVDSLEAERQKVAATQELVEAERRKTAAAQEIAEAERQNAAAERQKATAAQEIAEAERQKAAESAALANRLNVLNSEMLEYKKFVLKEQEVYIQATLEQARQGLYKIGKAKSSTARNSSLNSGHPAGDSMAILKVVKTHDADALEKRIHHALQHIRPASNREFFMAPYRLLGRIVEKLSSSFEADIEEANQLINEIIELHKLPQGIDWMDGLSPDDFNRPATATVTIKTGRKVSVDLLRKITHIAAVQLLQTILQEYIVQHPPAASAELVPANTPPPPLVIKKVAFVEYAKAKIQSIYKLQKADLPNVRFSNFLRAMKDLAVRFM